MAETLLTPSSVKMYGRIMSDLAFNYNASTVVIGSNNFLQEQFSPYGVNLTGTTTNGSKDITPVSSVADIGVGMNLSTPINGVFLNNSTTITAVSPNKITVFDAAQSAQNNISMTVVWQTNFARIYAFSFEGAIYGLPKPSIFLVHGAGLPISLDNGRVSRSTMDMSGVAAREWEFSDTLKKAVDLVYWEYEKGDFSLRLDTEAGPLEQILLAAAIRGADMGDRSGANLGIRSGANLSGANVSGANLSGANLRNR